MGKWLTSSILSNIFSGFRSLSLALSSSSSSPSSEHDTDPPKYSSKSLVTNNEIVYRSVIMVFQFILLSFGLFQLISNCYRNENYYNENENFCSLMNIGTSKLALIFLVYCFLITLLLWVDYSHALKAIKSYKRTTTTTNDSLIAENRSAHNDDDDTSNSNRQENNSMFRRYRIPLIIFFTLSAVLYVLYFVIIPLAPKVYTTYDRVVTYSLLSLLVILAVLIIIYGVGLTYISRDYLKNNLKKASNRVTILSCVSGVFVLIYAAWVAGNNTRVRLGYRLNTSWAMFLEQVFEAFSLSIMTYMLRSTGRKVPKWKKEMNKRMRRPIYDMTEY